MQTEKRSAPARWLSLLVALSASWAEAAAYPRGTALEEMWFSPARIDPEEAVHRIASQLLSSPELSGEEPDPIDVETFEAETLRSEDIESIKYFLASDSAEVEEIESPMPGNRRFRGEIALDAADPEYEAFAEDLAREIVDRLGVTEGFALTRLPAEGDASAVVRGLEGCASSGFVRIQNPAPQSGPCMDLRLKFAAIRYEVDFGWTIDVVGLAVVGVNIEYSGTGSDMLYVLFPFGWEVSWWNGIECLWKHKGLPSTMDEAESCGSRRIWEILGNSTATLSTETSRFTPGVALASPTYLGLSTYANESAVTIRNHFQTWPPDGPASCAVVPEMMSTEWRPSKCWRYTYGGSPGVSFRWFFARIVTWLPDVILSSGQAIGSSTAGATFEFHAYSAGNPHKLIGGWPWRKWGHGRAHALTACP